jgi:fatty acid-binding protein DegV
MTIKIVTDRSCDLRDDLLNSQEISVIPYFNYIGGQEFLNGIDLSQEAHRCQP